MLRYARKKGSSKSKRKGQPKAGTPVALWKPCNAAHDSRGAEFENRTRAVVHGKQHRGHVCLSDCGCAKALGARPKTEAEIIRANAAKLTERLASAHDATGRVCEKCCLLIPVNGTHDC